VKHLQPGPLTPEERVFLATVYEGMVRDAAGGDDDALSGLNDPFWVFYADVMLHGHDRMMRLIQRLTNARKPRRIIPRGGPTTRLERAPTGRRSRAWRQ
jgi:hypothetical protein